MVGPAPNRERCRSIGAVLLLAVVIGCAQPSAPAGVEVKEIVVGRSLAADGTIEESARTNLFWATDAFVVSVTLEGAADDLTMQARWTGPDGNVVSESSEPVTLQGTTATAFEAAPPDGRWPAGDYTVEILINGKSQGTRDLNAR